MMAEFNPPMPGRRVSDMRAMERIAALMSGKEWSPDTLDEIAEIVRATGREIAEVSDGR